MLEAAQSWVDGTDYNYWLPSENDPTRQPQGHPYFYVGIHFLILKFFTMLGLTDPQGKLYFIRIIIIPGIFEFIFFYINKVINYF